MNFVLDLNLVLNSATAVGVVWLIKTAVGTREIMIKLKQWVNDHDKQDDARHAEINKQLDNLWRKIEGKR